ncbi:MAG TPA: SRPBCC family protein [Actinomycetes bacterium]|nr:SRPBCC family protein [Actinomycetes bacterium]
MAVQYTAYERPRRLAASIRMAAADIFGTLRFDPVASGTRMSWSWEIRLRGLYKLLTPIIAGARSRPTGPGSSGSWKDRGA